MKFIRNGLLLFFLACAFQPATGQTDTLNPAYRPFNQYRTLALPEKLFVHTDRNFYLTGENLWFRIFYVDGTLHRPMELSKVAYLESSTVKAGRSCRPKFPLKKVCVMVVSSCRPPSVRVTTPCGPTPPGCATSVRIFLSAADNHRESVQTDGAAAADRSGCP